MHLAVLVAKSDMNTKVCILFEYSGKCSNYVHIQCGGENVLALSKTLYQYNTLTLSALICAVFNWACFSAFEGFLIACVGGINVALLV